MPKIVASDNASMYLAAADELQRLLQSDQLTELLGRLGVLWHFIPKRAPWYVVVRASHWFNEDVTEEGAWQIKSHLTSSPDSSS